MTVAELFRKGDVKECVDALVALHRRHYHHPGYTLNSRLVREKYTDKFNNIASAPGKSGDTITIKYDENSSTYRLKYKNQLMRDLNIQDQQLGSATIKHHGTALSDEQIITEILFETTYHTL